MGEDEIFLYYVVIQGTLITYILYNYIIMAYYYVRLKIFERKLRRIRKEY